MSQQREQQRPPRLPGAWTLTRDIVSFAGGWWVIWNEVQRTEIRESVLLFAGAIIGIPGLAIGASSVAEAIRSRTGTGDSPSASPQSADSPPS